MPISTDPVDYRLEEAQRLLVVRWRDGHESHYGFDDLRKVCPCADCRTAEAEKPTGGASGSRRSGGPPGGDSDRRDLARRSIRVGFHLE